MNAIPFLLVAAVAAVAGAPQAFQYQAIARDNAGKPLPSTDVSFRMSILSDSANGSIVYQEIHSVKTDAQGGIHLEIGKGTVGAGKLDTVSWGASPKYLRVEMDPSGGINYTVNGTSPLLSVPYALYAEKSGGLNPGTNPNDLLTWDGNNWVAKPLDVNALNLNNRQPFLGVSYAIALTGIFPSRNQPEPFIGQLMLTGFNFPPRGWALCDGQLLPIAQNTALFSLLGTTYGGDGRTTFALPDLRGRVPVHQGTGPGLSQVRIGEKGGSEKIIK